MAEEILSRLLKRDFEEGQIEAFSHPRGVPLISHLLYTDDIVTFTNGNLKSLRNILKLFDTYEQWSSQSVSTEKSSFNFSKDITPARQRFLLRSTGFKEGSSPFRYLGVPIVLGKLKVMYLEEIMAKICEYAYPFVINSAGFEGFFEDAKCLF